MDEAVAVIPVLYEDDDLVIVDKPPGMTVHRNERSRRGERFVLQTVSAQIGRYVHPVQRLDRNTSGALCLTLSAEATRAVQAHLATDGARKEYLTLARGTTPESFVSERPLSNDAGTPRPARSEFRRLATFSRCSLLEVVLRTGRRHQIRRHLDHLAHQVIGDTTHGKGRINNWFRTEYGLPRMVLHASRLAIDHPVTGARVDVRVPLAPDLRAFLARLPDVDPAQLATW